MRNIFLARSLSVQRNFTVMYVTTPSVNQVSHPFWKMIIYLPLILRKLLAFGNYFATVFVEDNQTLPEFNPRCNGRVNHFTCNIPTMIKIVKKLKPNASPGPDMVICYHC